MLICDYIVYSVQYIEYCGWNCCCVAGLYSSEILRALVKLGNLSHYLRRVLYILGGAGFLNISEPWMTVDVFFVLRYCSCMLDSGWSLEPIFVGNISESHAEISDAWLLANHRLE